MIRQSTRALGRMFKMVRPMMARPVLCFKSDDKPVKTEKPKSVIPDKIVDVANKLEKTLDKEITYEKENLPKDDETIKALKEKGWEVSNEGSLYELKKKAGDKEVLITFTVRSPPQEKEAQEKDKKDDKPEDKEEPDTDISEFSVYVKKPGHQELLVAEYLSSGNEKNLVNVSFTHDYVSHSRGNKLDRPLTKYQGPELETIDEVLLQNLQEYIESLGIDDDLVSFVSEYSVHAEHPHYVKWLEDLRRFIR